MAIERSHRNSLVNANISRKTGNASCLHARYNPGPKDNIIKIKDSVNFISESNKNVFTSEEINEFSESTNLFKMRF